MRKAKTRVLALLPAVAVVFGCLEFGPGHGPDPGGSLFTLHVVLSLAVVFVWFSMDARERAYRPSTFLQIAMVALTSLALPYYLFRSRGVAGGFRALGLALLTFAGTMAAYHVGTWLA